MARGTALLGVAAVVAVVVGAALLGPQDEKPRAIESPEQAERRSFLRLVEEHPLQRVRETLPFFRDGRLRFECNPQVYTRPLYYTEKKAVVSGIYFSDQQVPLCAKNITVAHELQHAMDDLAGLSVAAEMRGDDEEALRRHVERFFLFEWRGGQAEFALKDIPCPGFEKWKQPNLCENFKREMMLDGVHLERRMFDDHPSLKQWVEGLDCNSLR